MGEAFQHLGYPSYFRVELAVAKALGALLLILPLGNNIKEWAYAGFTFTFISAYIAYTISGDPTANQAMPLVFLLLLAVSYVTNKKRKQLVQA